MVRIWVGAPSFRRPQHSANRPGTHGLQLSQLRSRAWVSGSISLAAVLCGALAVYALYSIHAHYIFGLQSPLRLRWQSPLVVSRRVQTPAAAEAREDQLHSLNAYQQYACRKFGPACRVALAIQRIENPQGNCEVYHYNTDGTLDWGYFQINTVHLKRRGVNLRDLLDCKANIDFAYKLFVESRGFSPWSSYNSGAYRRALRD